MYKKIMIGGVLIGTLVYITDLSKLIIPEKTNAAAHVNRSITTPISNFKIDILNVETSKLADMLPTNITQKDFICLAQAVYFEARSEPVAGQVAVASVVLNRTKHKRYPNSICGVVFQNDHRRNLCQFSFACDGKSDTAYNKAAWNDSKRIAAAMLTNRYSDVTRNAMFYHADYVSPKWAKTMQKTVQIGTHMFYDDES